MVDYVGTMFKSSLSVVALSIAFLGGVIFEDSRTLERDMRIERQENEEAMGGFSHFYATMRVNGLEDKVKETRRTFDTDGDGVDDYVVQLEDGSVKIVPGYNPARDN